MTAEEKKELGKGLKVTLFLAVSVSVFFYCLYINILSNNLNQKHIEIEKVDTLKQK